MKSICLAAPKNHITEASSTGCPIACMTYRISGSGRLLRTEMPQGAAGGLMYIDDCGEFTAPDRMLPGDVIRECAARRFSGVVLDLSPEMPNEIAEELSSVCRKNRLTVFVPQHLAMCQGAVVMIPTGITTGSLSRRLRSAADRYGANRVAMAVDFLRGDYALPAKTGNGTELTADELSSLKARYRSASFFSKDLCAYYFTYRTGNRTHLVLYDNAVSVRRKLSLGESLGIETAFLYYPHVKDFLDRILEN